MNDNPSIAKPAVFDLGFAIRSNPDVGVPLQVAQSVVQGALQRINQHVTSQVADAAVTADQLGTKIGQHIQQQLGGAGFAAVELSNPIQTDVAGKLGAAMEAAMPLGIVPPNPNNLGVMPMSVQIREAALNGNLDPAVEAYKVTALPLRDFGGAEFARSVQAIQAALPQDQDTQAAFASRIAGLQMPLPDVAGQSAGVAECSGQAALAAQQALANCASHNPLGGPEFAACAETVQAASMATLAQCEQTIGGIPAESAGGGGSHPGSQPASHPPGGGMPVKPPVSPHGGPSGAPSGGSGGIPSPGLSGGPIAAGGGGGGGSPPTAVLPSVGLSPLLQPGGTIQPPIYLANPLHGNPPGWYVQDASGQFVQVTPAPPGYSGPTIPVAGAQGGGGLMNVGDQPGLSGSASSGSMSSTSAGGASGGSPGPSCDLNTMRLDGQAYFDQTQDINATAAYLAQKYGVVAAAQRQTLPCDTGYQHLGIDTGGVYSSGFDVCVKCPPAIVQSSGCCPVNVTVNCPPAQPTQPTAPTTPPAPKPPIPETPPPSPPFRPGAIQQQIAGCEEFGPAPGIPLPNGFQNLSQLLGLKNADGTIAGTDPGLDPTGIINRVSKTLVSFVAGLVDQVGAFLQSVASESGCSDGEQMALIGTALVVRLAERLFGDALKGIAEPNRQQREYRCPTELPNASEAAAAWLGGQIDDATLECWSRAAGKRFPEWKRFVDSSRQKLQNFQLGSLFLRGKLTADQLQQRLRISGWTQQTDVTELEELLKQIPPASDLVRFMVRDAGDANLVQQFGMDTDFNVKYSQQIKDWARAQGVSDDYMQYVWRSHWSIPAPTQLYEMLHRSASLPAGDPAAVTLADVKTALEQQDILPFWIDKFINISYRPLTRIDAKRAFQIGALDAAGLKKAYTDQGYNSDNADILVDFNSKQNRLVLYRSPIVKSYAAGELTDEQFSAALQQLGANDEDIQGCKDQAGFIADRDSRKRCINALHRRFLLGDIDHADAVSSLSQRGVSPSIAGTIVAGWQCELSARGKNIPAAQLAGLYADGAIDAPGLTQRLQRLGYSYDDAVLLQRRMARQNQIKVDKDEARKLREQERIANADARSQAAVQRTIQRNLLKQARAAETMQRVNLLREKRLIESGKHLSEHLQLPLSDAVILAKSTYRSYLAMSTYLPDEIIAAIVTTGGDKNVATAADFQAAVAGILQSGPVGGDVPQADILLASQVTPQSTPSPPPSSSKS